MTLKGWFTFMFLAMCWGGATHVAAHYAAVTLNTYRAKRVEEFYERQIRQFLQ